MRKHSKLLMIALLMLGTRGSFAQGPPGNQPPPEVAYVTIERDTVPVTFDYVGVTEASKVVEIRARIQGFLETRDFEEGALVQAGEQLFSIDPRSFRADREIALSRVEQAEARLRLAEQEVKRLKSVEVPGAIAESDLDKQLAEQANAAASLRLAKAELAKADLELSYTTVESPLTGFIGKAEKEIGSLVDANQNSLLTVLRQVDPIYVSFQVSERDYLRWRTQVETGELVLAEGDQPYLTMELFDGQPYGTRGIVNFQSTNVDLQTGTVEVRGTFENPDYDLKPGQFVTVHVGGWVRQNTITVPQRAVSQSPQGAYVYVIDENDQAEFRIVTPGPWSGSDWIVEDGLEPGERVIVEGIIHVQPGIAVSPVPFEAAPAAAVAE